MFHLRQRLRPISIFYELLCPITFQQVRALLLFRPLLHEILSVLHQCISSHQISLYQCCFLYLVVGASYNSLNLVPLTALPYLTVNSCTAYCSASLSVQILYYSLRKLSWMQINFFPTGRNRSFSHAFKGNEYVKRKKTP